MDPFHVVKLAADAVDKTRQRTQQEIFSRRGRAGDPLYGSRKPLLTSWEFLTPAGHERLEALFATAAHAPVEVTWNVYQNIVAICREEHHGFAGFAMNQLIGTIAKGVPKDLKELGRLGRTLNRHKDDILAFFTHPGTSNGHTEAINGRLERLRGSALGFRNLTHYIACALLETGGFRHQLHHNL